MAKAWVWQCVLQDGILVITHGDQQHSPHPQQSLGAANAACPCPPPAPAACAAEVLLTAVLLVGIAMSLSSLELPEALQAVSLKLVEVG